MVIEVYEAEAQPLVAPTATLKQLADGFQFTEVWKGK